MRKKKCPVCGKEVKSDFNFCPYCGNPLRERSVVTAEELFDQFEKIIDEEFKKIESMFGFPIPRIKLFPAKKKMEEEGVKRKKYKKVEEAEMKIEENEIEKIFRIMLPGVKKEEDIEIKELDESLEVRAYGKNKLYFKLVPVNPRKVSGKEFKKEVLSIFARK